MGLARACPQDLANGPVVDRCHCLEHLGAGGYKIESNQFDPHGRRSHVDEINIVSGFLVTIPLSKGGKTEAETTQERYFRLKHQQTFIDLSKCKYRQAEAIALHYSQMAGTAAHLLQLIRVKQSGSYKGASVPHAILDIANRIKAHHFSALGIPLGYPDNDFLSHSFIKDDKWWELEDNQKEPKN